MFSKKWKKALEAAIPTIVGILLLLYQIGGKIILQSGWKGDYLFTFFCFGLISFGIGQLRMNNVADQIKYTVSSFLVFVLTFVLNGSNLFVNDVTLASLEGATETGYALDVIGGGVSTVASVVKAITYAVPSIVLIFVVINIFHSEDTDDYQQMLIEGASAVGFIILIGASGSYFGFGFSIVPIILLNTAFASMKIIAVFGLVSGVGMLYANYKDEEEEENDEEIKAYEPEYAQVPPMVACA